jgi:hypothetical protein
MSLSLSCPQVNSNVLESGIYLSKNCLSVCRMAYSFVIPLGFNTIPQLPLFVFYPVVKLLPTIKNIPSIVLAAKQKQKRVITYCLAIQIYVRITKGCLETFQLLVVEINIDI